jgi:hypothetical protein
VVSRQVPVENVTPLQQQQAGQGIPVAIAQGLLPITLARPEVNRRDHTYKGSTISEHQQISGF